VFVRGFGQGGVAGAAEGVESRFRGLRQIGAWCAVALETTADAGFVDEVVMADYAAYGRVLFVREVYWQLGGRDRLL
jgi:hypothetical protein